MIIFDNQIINWWKKTMYASLLILLIVFNHLTAYSQNKLICKVNVFIGTGGHGQSFPHAMVPFDAAAWGPDWETQGWDAAGCNHYDAKNILGFSQVHLSDTGLIEGGKLLLMPTVGKIKVDPGTYENPDAGYRSRFSHTDEKATSGYFF